jgi:hypothetical protein
MNEHPLKCFFCALPAPPCLPLPACLAALPVG